LTRDKNASLWTSTGGPAAFMLLRAANLASTSAPELRLIGTTLDRPIRPDTGTGSILDLREDIPARAFDLAIDDAPVVFSTLAGFRSNSFVRGGIGKAFSGSLEAGTAESCSDDRERFLHAKAVPDVPSIHAFDASATGSMPRKMYVSR